MAETEEEDIFSSLLSQVADAMGALGLHTETLSLVNWGGSEETIPEELKNEPLSDEIVVKMIKEGRMDFAILGQFRTADLAWSERTLYPDRFSETALLRELVPSEEDVLKGILQEQIDAGVDPADVVIPDQFKNLGQGE